MPSVEATTITIKIKDEMSLTLKEIFKDCPFDIRVAHEEPESYLEVEFSADEKEVLELLLEREFSSLGLSKWVAIHNLVSEGLVVEVDDGYSEWGVPPIEEFQLTPLGKTLMENYKTYGKFIFFLAED